MGQKLWFCPGCGMAHGQRAVRKVKYIILEKKPYLDTIEFDPDKPFGVEVQAMGRGIPPVVVRYLQPEDIPEDFARVKKRMLDAMLEWVKKGWLTPDEVSSAIKGGVKP